MTADHGRMEDAVVAFALDACDDDEAERVRAHIVACPSCRALVHRLSQVVEALPLGTDLERPPDRLRARILAAAAAAPPLAADERPRPRRIVALPQSGGAARRRPTFAWPAVAVVVIGLLGLVVWNVMLSRQVGPQPMRHVLVGTGTLASASGTVTQLTGQDAAVAALTGMPAAPTGRVYELWVTDASGQTVPAGVFTPTPNGTATVRITRSLTGVQTVAVTQEPAPHGSGKPSEKPELAVQITG